MSQKPDVNGIRKIQSNKAQVGLESTSYPSRSLHFLHVLYKGSLRGTREDAPQAKLRLKIIIAGAGLGGLATAIALRRRGHSVTVFEKTPELGEVGAGIQVPPNSSRLLLKWGLEPFFKDKVVEPATIGFRRWQNGNLIGLTRLVPDCRRAFDAPYYVVHRAHFQNAMNKLALDLGVEIHMNSGVARYDPDIPSLTLENGTTYSADLIVAADGLRSEARKVVLQGKDQPPQRTGFAAYRAVVDVEKMRADPDVAWLLEKPGLNCWIGDMRHVMTYTIAAGKSFNMVLSHPEESDPSTWRQETAVSDMKQHFKGWDYRLTKIIDMIESTLKWPLLSGKPLEKWVASSGKLLIIGDAAHVMVPYMSEGAAMAVEDGAALAEILNKINSKDQIHDALRIFEDVRILRTGQMQEASLINGKLWHFADGPEQEARDEAMRPEVEGRHYIESPNQWSDPVTQSWAYGYDAEKEVANAWNTRVSRGSKLWVAAL